MPPGALVALSKEKPAQNQPRRQGSDGDRDRIFFGILLEFFRRAARLSGSLLGEAASLLAEPEALVEYVVEDLFGNAADLFRERGQVCSHSSSSKWG
jgi:hypothetical protein